MSQPIAEVLPMPSTAKGAATTQTLTSSYATVGEQFSVAHAGQLAVDAIFTPGDNGNTMSYFLEFSPDSIEKSEATSKWFQQGKYTDSSGTWTEEPATFAKVGTTAATAYPIVPLELPTTHQKARLRAKDNPSSVHGTIQAYINLIPFVA